MSKLYRGPSIDASYQVSVHLAKRFQRRRFLKIGQSETRITCGDHVCFGITSHPSFVVCHLLTFHILIFSSETHQPNELKLSTKHLWKVLSKECPFCYAPLPNKATTGNSFFWLANFQLVRQLQRGRFFRYRQFRNKNCLWWPCLLTDRDEMSNLHRGGVRRLLSVIC
jgi:hypothetical protein